MLNVDPLSMTSPAFVDCWTTGAAFLAERYDLCYTYFMQAKIK